MSLESKTVDGWANNETRTIWIAISNDQDAYDLWRARTKYFAVNREHLAGDLESRYGDEEHYPSLKMPYSSLLQLAFERVDWLELADHMIETWFKED